MEKYLVKLAFFLYFNVKKHPEESQISNFVIMVAMNEIPKLFLKVVYNIYHVICYIFSENRALFFWNNKIVDF